MIALRISQKKTSSNTHLHYWTRVFSPYDTRTCKSLEIYIFLFFAVHFAHNNKVYHNNCTIIKLKYMQWYIKLDRSLYSLNSNNLWKYLTRGYPKLTRSLYMPGVEGVSQPAACRQSLPGEVVQWFFVRAPDAFVILAKEREQRAVVFFFVG